MRWTWRSAATAMTAPRYCTVFGCAGVLEIIDDGVGGTYRAVYTVKFGEAVFVLHCFQKKSKSGIATPKQEMDLVRARLHSAQQWIEELRHEKTHRR